ncbi:hypothetical protein [Edaphobacter modestus]|uniref:hypothetical protein n=1 Tax=Edaphobacter modestus TaxID=388466 RepID=UPI001F5EFCBD|nr:hypothetical protein [Edaphobacter modestus]
MSRRRFLRDMTGAGAGLLIGARRASALRREYGQKTIIVTFGGGARDQETFAPEGQRYIPRILMELIPRATFYTQVVNRGILGHYVANASLATGCYESFNNFQSIRPENPTIFEYFRQDRRRQASDVWVIAPSNGFTSIGESGHPAYGRGKGATVVLPKALLAGVSGGSERPFESLLRDSHEGPVGAGVYASTARQDEAIRDLLQISMSDFKAHAQSVSSPDELSLYIALHLMRSKAPSLIWITLHDIDIAHAGAFSLYTDAIQRTDRICAELVRAMDQEPEYKGQTNFFILPDFGRDADDDPSGNGFQHHRSGDALCRTTWLLAMGPGIRENTTVDRPVESIDLVPTVAKMLACDARFAQGRPLVEVL